MGAAEQQGIDVGGQQRGEQALGQHGHLVAVVTAALDELDEARARRRLQPTTDAALAAASSTAWR